MTAESEFQSKVKKLQDAAQLIGYHKVQLELGRKQLEYCIKALEEAPGEAYLSVGPVFIKYRDDALKSKLEDRIRTIDASLEGLDRRMRGIRAESRRLQEERRAT